MATRLKTVEYWFPQLATAADATDTDFTQITVYLPESSVTFRKAILDVVYHDANTTLTGTCARRQLSVQLAAAGYTTSNDTTTQTFSGENYVGATSADFTSYFNTNWTGTSMTCDARFLYDMSTATPLGARNLSAKLTITYTYDDTSTTHIKTVRIPLYAPVGNCATSKPGSAVATFPNLSTFLPEASVTIRQWTTVVQGNTHGAATDTSISWQYDTDGVFTSGLYEHGGNQSMWYRVSNVESHTTNATHGFYLWASTAIFSHPQVWAVVTYEFDASASTRILNSLILPMEFTSPMGGPTASDYQRATRELWIEEPGTVTLLNSALYIHWDQAAAISGLHARVGTGSFVAYSDANGATSNAGGFGLMVKDPGSGAITLARGRNTLQADIYTTDTADLGWNVSSWWIINYSSDKATDGVGAHNHTVIRNMKTYGIDGSSTSITLQTIVAADAPDIPETLYFLTSVGCWYQYISNTTNNAAGCHIGVERLAGEGGIEWEQVYSDVGHTDPEVGIRQVMATARSVFRRWPSDADSDRLAFETSRRWRSALGGGASSLDHLDIIFTYHTILFTVAGTITGSAGGTVNLYLNRTATGEMIKVSSRSGNGAYSISWYDDTEDVYVDAYEDGTHLGRSDTGKAA